jgi:uncharacterized protein YaaW (UPF0174 family)
MQGGSPEANDKKRNYIKNKENLINDLKERLKDNYNSPTNTLNLDDTFDKEILSAFADDLIEESKNEEMKKLESALWKRICSTKKDKEPKSNFYEQLKDVIKKKYSSLSDIQKWNLTNLLRKE